MDISEAEWFDCNSGYMLLSEAVHAEMPECNFRRMRLVGVALLRMVWDDVPPGAKKAIEAAELHTDGLISDEELSAAGDLAGEGFDLKHRPGRRDQNKRREYALYDLAWSASEIARYDDEGGWPYWQRILQMSVLFGHCYERLGIEEEDVQPAICHRIRDIYGNPFQEVDYDPNWVTSEVDELAREIHQQGAYQRMPELADALQYGGCTDAQILNHCNSEEVHVRGCWVVDLLLGKNQAIQGN